MVAALGSGADEVGGYLLGLGREGGELAESGVRGAKGLWEAVAGAGRSADEVAGTVASAAGRTPGIIRRTFRRIPPWARIAGGLTLAGGGAIAGRLATSGDEEEGYGFDLGMPTVGTADDSAIRRLIEEQYAGGGAGGAGADYGALRTGFRDWANTLRGYGAGQTEALGREYGALADRAAADAAEAEAIARMAYGNIGRIGSEYAGQAVSDITSPGAGGPTETTGLVPVSGEMADIPGRIADTSQIAADFVLRDLNLTRDDLAYMGNVARMMGPAYAAQLNNTINLAIANRKMELDQSIAAQQAADARAAAASEAARRDAYYDRLIALEGMRASQQAAVTPDFIQTQADAFQRQLESPRGRQALQAAGINVDNPTVGFQQFLNISLRGATSAGS